MGRRSFLVSGTAFAVRSMVSFCKDSKVRNDSRIRANMTFRAKMKGMVESENYHIPRQRLAKQLVAASNITASDGLDHLTIHI